MQYSQTTALWAITKASFKAILSQPSSIFFSLLFPIIFIFIFGAFEDHAPSPKLVAIDVNSDTSSELFDSLAKGHIVKLIPYSDTAVRNEDLRKGRIDAVLRFEKKPDQTYILHLQSSEASKAEMMELIRQLDYASLKIELNDAHLKREYAIKSSVIPGQKYRSIDFVLPGQIGFSILFSTLFGIAFVFFNLREQLVLKRFYASPVNRINILIGIGVSRLFYQLINVAVLILFGHFLLKFTLAHGFITFAEMLVLSVYMLFLLMGVGLIISSLSKNDTVIPLFINVFGFPQILLSGTFFSTNVFPKWLQHICELLPLTQFNNAMRKISFEGLHLSNCLKEIGILGIWIVLIYILVLKVMRWE